MISLEINEWRQKVIDKIIKSKVDWKFTIPYLHWLKIEETDQQLNNLLILTKFIKNVDWKKSDIKEYYGTNYIYF